MRNCAQSRESGTTDQGTYAMPNAHWHIEGIANFCVMYHGMVSKGRYLPYTTELSPLTLRIMPLRKPR
jgi:hypothetical protein